MNEITNRSVPGRLEVLGQTAAPSVSINGQPATRQGNRYGVELAVDNSSGPQQVEVEVQATQGADSTQKTVKKDLPAAQQAFAYDDDGNLLNNGIWSYTWDAENRLSETEYLLASADSERRKFLYVYDHQSRRTLKREMRWDTAKAAWYAERQIKYIYDGWNCIAEILNEATLSKKHTWGLDLSGSIQGAGGVGGLLATEDVLNDYQAAPCYDGNGNVIALVNHSGDLLAEYEYTAFGRTLSAKGPQAKTNTYRFSTKPQEKETGLYYYGYRYYEPELGRWPSRDPIEEDGGINLYGFVGNDGINHSDKLGLVRVGQTYNLKTGFFGKKCAIATVKAYQAGTGTIRIGNVIGIGIWGELSISAQFTADNSHKSCCCKTLRWVQTITADNGPSMRGKPVPRPDGAFPDGMSFRDTPFEPVVGGGMWSANNPNGQQNLKLKFSLKVICVKNDDTEKKMKTIKWGLEAKLKTRRDGTNYYDVKTL